MAALFGLFGKKKEGDSPTHTHTTAQNYPTDPLRAAAEAEYSHGHEGQLTPQEAEQEKQFTPQEAEQEKQRGLMGKLHRTNSPSPRFSSDAEEEGKKKGGRRKKGVKEKLPEVRSSSEQCDGEWEEEGVVDKIKDQAPRYGEGEKEERVVDKIKDKLSRHHNSNE